jgi:3-oxoacyl-[acyl-carrier-protein] synthase-1
MNSRAFPISAYSVVNGLGASTRSVLDRLFAGESGLTRCPAEFGVETWCGQVRDPLPKIPDAWRDYDSRQAQLCLLALAPIAANVRASVARYGAHRVAVVFGTSTGGISRSEAAVAGMVRGESLDDSFHVHHQHALSAALAVIRTQCRALGPAYVISNACSSSAKVFGSALRLLRNEHADAVLVGGVDTLCHLTLRGFAALEVISRDPSRPFSQVRKGINIGEGGAFVLIERDADAHLGLYGVGETSDAHHMTAPHPEGEGAFAAMHQALCDANLSPEDIDHVNAHGTASQQNDNAESRAIVRLFGPQMDVVATKGATGHLLGAAGATEVVFALESLRRGVRPPSLGSEPLDTSLEVRMSEHCRPTQKRFALSNSLAFGGSNASVVVGVWP